MSLFESAILGVIQGLTEFLPVSSSGHLILVREFFGIHGTGDLAFDVILHVGTLLAIIITFRKTLIALLKDAWNLATGKRSAVKKEDSSLLLALILGTIPAALAGYFLEDFIENSIRSPRIVVAMLIAGSLLMIAAERYAKPKDETVSPKTGWWVGWFQMLALLPGMSRSGSTIAGGMLLGVNRVYAARFSFYLAIPIIAGSGLKKILDLAAGDAAIAYPQLVVGFVTSFLVGWLAINLFLKFLKTHTLYVFAAYRILLAALVFFIL